MRAMWTCCGPFAPTREVGYPYMLMPDHVPGIDGDEARQVGFAYCYGYIHAMIQAANEATTS